MSDSPAWQVWLDEARAVRVRRALATLADSLLHLAPQEIPPVPGLIAGRPGIALAHGYLAQAGFGDAHHERCQTLVEESIEHIGMLAGDCSLGGGLPGLGFVLEQLGANEDDDHCAELDEAVADALAAQSDVPDELLWGLAGAAVYARERLPRKSGAALHELVVTRLVADARPQPDDALAWFAATDPRFGKTPLFEQFPDGTYNLGVAHGNPGIIALVAAAGGTRAPAAARAGMRWLWAQRFPSGPAAFPIHIGGPPYPVHGWCYGDEGVAAVMHAAARALDDEGWQARWLEVLQRCVARPPSTPRGLTLCHGTAGMAHLWNRVHQATGEARFAGAARAWLDATLDALPREKLPEAGLLDGTAGVALALVGFISDVEPAWDRLFALSLRAMPPTVAADG